jgi:hypothetical protein
VYPTIVPDAFVWMPFVLLLVMILTMPFVIFYTSKSVSFIRALAVGAGLPTLLLVLILAKLGSRPDHSETKIYLPEPVTETEGTDGE